MEAPSLITARFCAKILAKEITYFWSQLFLIIIQDHDNSFYLFLLYFLWIEKYKLDFESHRREHLSCQNPAWCNTASQQANHIEYFFN
jgi:hypothetical protein